MVTVIFEVKRLPPILCSYPGCERINGRVRPAKWLLRQLGGNQEFQPVCFACKARVKAMLGAGEQRSVCER
jgi:hypothetical protein